jgi:hypothetical protein
MSSSTEPVVIELPEKFSSIMIDFIKDLDTTFPEYKSSWWVYSEETSEEGWKDLYKYCLNIYPERFFDILYQNEELFKETNMDNTMFLPRVDFKKLYYAEGISKNTQESIWKYLQLVLFTIIGSVKDKTEFGNAMNMFEGVDETELQEKLTEAMSGLGDFFQDMEKNLGDSMDEKMENEGGEKMMDEMFEHLEKAKEEFEKHMENEEPASSSGMPNFGDMPNAEDLHSHLKGLFGGKLGSLAKELMEELTDDIQETLGINPNDFNENSKPTDVFKKLMRQPDKFMKLVQKIQGKFQEKMNSGDLSQEDLMKEASDMLQKMKEMGGNSKQMQEMFQNMAKNMGGMGGMGGMGKNMKMDTAKLDRMFKSQETKDRLRAKAQKHREDKFKLEQDQGKLVYRPNDAEKQEKSLMTDEQIAKIAEEIGEVAPTPATKPKAKKNKNKKKK